MTRKGKTKAEQNLQGKEKENMKSMTRKEENRKDMEGTEGNTEEIVRMGRKEILSMEWKKETGEGKEEIQNLSIKQKEEELEKTMKKKEEGKGEKWK